MRSVTREMKCEGVDLRGTLANFVAIDAAANFLEGRYFTDSEDLHRDNVVVLGEDIGKALFGDSPAVDKEF